MAQINKGTTYSTVNSTVTIENLNAHVADATLLPGAISDQTDLGAAANTSAQILLLSSGQLYKATLAQAATNVVPAAAMLKANNLSDLADAPTSRTNLGIGNVENKSSATIRGELTAANVSSALTYVPVSPTQLSVSENSRIATSQIPSFVATSQIGGIVASSAQIAPLQNSAQVQALTTAQLSAITINPGVGLAGGGALNANSTLSLAALSPSPAGSVGAAAAIPVLTVDQYGRITSASTAVSTPVNVNYLLETAVVSATAATGTIAFDLLTQPTLFYSSNATGNFTVNLRGSSVATFNSIAAVGQSATFSFLAQAGTTAYNLSAIQVDGVAQTVKWANGTVPVAVASSVNVYTITVIKTGANAYTVFGNFSRFA